MIATPHRRQERSSSCTAASIAISFALCGQDICEDDLKGYVSTSFWSDLGRRASPTSSYGEITWLGRDNTFDFNDFFVREVFRLSMASPDALALMQVGANAFGAFLEEREADLALYGALFSRRGVQHTIVAVGAPPDGLCLWDPWSGPQGQPFQVTWDQLWALDPLSFLWIDRRALRKPASPEDRV
jgi:hypothetical protein